MISEVKVTGNKATVVLSSEADGAAGYDYVISTDRECITNKDYASVNKNQVQTLLHSNMYSRNLLRILPRLET